jgi:hypothetical protein
MNKTPEQQLWQLKEAVSYWCAEYYRRPNGRFNKINYEHAQEQLRRALDQQQECQS